MVSAPEKLIGLDRPHAQQEFAIVLGSVGTRMNSPMTVRTERNHKARVVRSAVGEPTDVVGLEIGHPVCTKERRRLAAAFTMSLGTGDHIVAHVSAAFKNGSCRRGFGGSRVSSREGSLTKLAQVRRRGRHLLDLLDDGSDGPQFEDDSIAHIRKAIRCRLEVVSLIDVLVLKAQAAWRLPKEQQACPIGGMVGDRSVATLHLHMANLSFSKVLEHSVRAQSVGVAVCETFFASDDDHKLVLGRRDNSALLLPAKPTVNICPTVINPATLKPPRHSFPRRSIVRVLASSGCARVKTARAAA